MQKSQVYRPEINCKNLLINKLNEKKLPLVNDLLKTVYFYFLFQENFCTFTS